MTDAPPQSASPPRLPPPPPEALGPAVETPGGGVAYGVADTRRVVTLQPRDPAEREAERAAAREQAQCRFCDGIPRPLLQALAQALSAARDEGREEGRRLR